MITRCIVHLCLAGCLAGCEGPEEKARRVVQEELDARREAFLESMKLYREGVEAYKNSDRERARQSFDESVALNRRNVQAWMHLGVVEFELYNLFEAAEAFQRASDLARDRYEPHFNLGSVFESAGKLDEAISEYKKAFELAPRSAEVMENLARCYLATNHDRGETAQLLENALAVEHRPEWIRWVRSQLQLLGERKETSEEKTHSESKDSAK